MDNARRSTRPGRAPHALALLDSAAEMRSRSAEDKALRPVSLESHSWQSAAKNPEKQLLQVELDGAILRLARALARQAAREDHARECADKVREHETRCDL